MLASDKKIEALAYGYSFNSKKMAQGPTFFNLRIMCHCLGLAVKRHLDFSRNTFSFLDELNEVKENERAFGLDKNDIEDLEQSGFSYCFQDDLKIPTDDKKMAERDAYKAKEEPGLELVMQTHAATEDAEKKDMFDYGSEDEIAKLREGDIDDLEIDMDMDLEEMQLIEQIRRDELLQQTLKAAEMGALVQP